MSPLRMLGSTSGYAELAPSAVAGDQTFTLPGTGGTLDRLNRAGNVLQVVNATYSTTVTSHSSTYADTGLTATITPSLASSKILILVNQVGLGKVNNHYLGLRLVRGATTLITFENEAGYTGSTLNQRVGGSGACYLDSPNTTSATTYKTQFNSTDNGATVFVNNNNVTSTITLMEIAA